MSLLHDSYEDEYEELFNKNEEQQNRFHSNHFKTFKKMDAWLNGFVIEGLMVEIVGYQVMPPTDEHRSHIVITVFVF